MSVAFLFPGQGSQCPGMLHNLPDHPAVRDMISQATEVLGRDVLELDTLEVLDSTIATQLALLIAGATVARMLGEESDGADFVAGHSVGAFAAAVAADRAAAHGRRTAIQGESELLSRGLQHPHGLLHHFGTDAVPAAAGQ